MSLLRIVLDCKRLSCWIFERSSWFPLGLMVTSVLKSKHHLLNTCFILVVLLEELDIVECQIQKSLELSQVRISDGFLEHFIFRSRSLESLILDHIYKRLRRFDICGSQSLIFSWRYILGRTYGRLMLQIWYQ